MNEVVDGGGRDDSLKTVGHISYLLHTIVAVAAVLPGAQASVALLLCGPLVGCGVALLRAKRAEPEEA